MRTCHNLDRVLRSLLRLLYYHCVAIMAPAPVTKRITTEAKAALKQVFDDLNIPRNKLYCAATLPTEICEVAEEHTLVYSQIARQLSNWKDKKYNFAGKIYSRDPDEIMQVLGDYVPGDNTQFVIDTISKRMIYEKGDDVCFANSYNTYKKNQLQLAALVAIADIRSHCICLKLIVFPFQMIRWQTATQWKEDRGI